MTDSIDETWLTTSKSEAQLNHRELEMYREHRRKLLTWMLNKGRAPEMNVGYAKEAAENRSYRLDMFYRWVWDIEDGYTESIRTSHANAYTKYLHSRSYSQAYKAAYQKSTHTLFRWQEHELGKTVDWEPKIHFYGSTVPSSIEPLTRDERRDPREAGLDYESVPHYNSVSPKQRDQWKSYVAQRLRKPKSEVTKEDFARANSWKWPSLIWTSLDAGLRLKEVSRAKVSWIDTPKALLRIPPEDAVKNSKHWNVGLKERTAMLLENWIEEREAYDKYSDSELLWLTQYETPYGS